VLQALRKIAEQKSEKPRFIYAHLTIPHSPYFFDSQGNLRPFRSRIGKVSAEEDRQLYLEQLRFVNQLIDQTIEVILTHSQTAPVILLQGDHGCWCISDSERDRESTTILNAYFLPENDSSLLYRSISPVNSFRVVFNVYFRGTYPLLPDKSFTVDQNFNVLEAK
jgi:hypothetical protein